MQVTKVLERSIDGVYNDFHEQNPYINISKSKFASLCLGNVKTMTKSKFNQCLFLLLYKHRAEAMIIKYFFGSKEKARKEDVRSLCCFKANPLSKEREMVVYERKVLERESDLCGVKKIRENLADVSEEYGKSSIL